MADPQLSSVAVDYSPPTRTPDGKLQFRIWVSAQYGRGRPADGVVVQIYVNNRLICTLRTRPDGRSEDYDYTSESPAASVTLEAWPEGDVSRRSTKMPRVDVRPSKPASVKHFKRRSPKDADKFLVFILVLDENENPVQGEVVYLRDPDDDRLIYSVGEPTDRYGMMNFDVKADPERRVFAMVRGLEERIDTADF